jgi:hypothetical protein
MEEMFNVPLCGIFLIMLSAMGLAAFSAVTVSSSLNHFNLYIIM